MTVPSARTWVFDDGDLGPAMVGQDAAIGGEEAPRMDCDRAEQGRDRLGVIDPRESGGLHVDGSSLMEAGDTDGRQVAHAGLRA